MFRNVLKYVKCPECQDKLNIISKREKDGEIIEGLLQCSNNHSWKVEEGIINFESKEQENTNKWSESYKKTDYEELDKKVKKNTPQIQLKAQEIAKNEVVDKIGKYNAVKVLDIGTGRGMLLTKLVESYGNNIELVCVDLSFEVLKYDRIKTLKINPEVKINYIACDATKLPMISNVFDLSVSYFGIQNMLELASLGVKEGVRVSKNGLINVGTVIKDNNPRIEKLNKMLKKHGFDFDVNSATESHFYKVHKIDESYKVEVKNIFEGIAEKNDNDLIPIEGEWFAIAISDTRIDNDRTIA